MNSGDIKIFFELLSDDEYCLLYNGTFVDAVTSKIINIAKVSLIQRGELIKTQNRFAFLIAECFQNIIRHGGHKDRVQRSEPLPGFFMAKIQTNYYDLVTSNLIENDKIQSLKDKFDQVNTLNRDELKALYNKTLAEGKLSEKGGAGIGLIDMARKSAQLEYKFINISDLDSMFYQRLVMTSSDINERIGKDNNIEFGIKLHNSMTEQKILVLQKSDFSRDSVLPMLNIVEENVKSNQKDGTLIKVIYQVLIELIQNINRSNLLLKNRKEGLFLISKSENSYNICASYVIDNNKTQWFEEFIDRVLNMNTEKLKKTYLNHLNIADHTEGMSDKNESIDIGKIIADKFSHGIHRMDDTTSIFTICANV